MGHILFDTFSIKVNSDGWIHVNDSIDFLRHKLGISKYGGIYFSNFFTNKSYKESIIIAFQNDENLELSQVSEICQNMEDRLILYIHPAVWIAWFLYVKNGTITISDFPKHPILDKWIVCVKKGIIDTGDNLPKYVLENSLDLHTEFIDLTTELSEMTEKFDQSQDWANELEENLKEKVKENLDYIYQLERAKELAEDLQTKINECIDFSANLVEELGTKRQRIE
jgi:hypothetical protein